MVAVGVGDFESFEGQLGEIAGKNVHTANNFDRLSDLLEAVIAETCSEFIYEEFVGYENNLI